MQSLKTIQTYSLVPHVGPTGVIKSQILSFWLSSLLLILLEDLNVLGGYRKSYSESRKPFRFTPGPHMGQTGS